MTTYAVWFRHYTKGETHTHALLLQKPHGEVLTEEEAEEMVLRKGYIVMRIVDIYNVGG